MSHRVSTLRWQIENKKLTTDQLKYLYNAILLPKVLYRLKCTVLLDRKCDVIMAPFKKLYKNISVLVSSLSNCFLHFSQALGLANLYQQHITNHITTFNYGLTARNSFSRII